LFLFLVQPLSIREDEVHGLDEDEDEVKSERTPINAK